jgi:hypothetical protein
LASLCVAALEPPALSGLLLNSKTFQYYFVLLVQHSLIDCLGTGTGTGTDTGIGIGYKTVTGFRSGPGNSILRYKLLFGRKKKIFLRLYDFFYMLTGKTGLAWRHILMRL